MTKVLQESGIGPGAFGWEPIAGQHAERAPATEVDSGAEDHVDLIVALDRIEASFPRERTVVHDCGRWTYQAFRRVHVPFPQAYVHAINFASVGLGMGCAIGAYFGAPDRPVLLLTGDGGFMMGGMAEFNTAVRCAIDLVVIVMNDSAYGAEVVQFEHLGMDPSIAMMDWPDLAPVATALGGIGITVRNSAELDAALAAVQSRDRPVLIDIKIEPVKVPPIH
jgi:thiamine pyrophosphate-dependent acetolactate synthase large subunit-like protein